MQRVGKPLHPTTPHLTEEDMNRTTKIKYSAVLVLTLSLGIILGHTTGKTLEHPTAKIVLVEEPAICPRC